jgi:hypothetical protein
VRSPARLLGVIGGKGVVFYARDEVVKFVDYFNLILSCWIGEGELTGVKDDIGAELDWVRGREGRVAEAGAEKWGARGDPFIGARGGEEGRLANTNEVYSGGDNGA